MRWARLSRQLLGATTVFVFSMVLVVCAWWQIQAQARHLGEARFESLAKVATESIVDRMGDYEQILRGAAGLVEVLPALDAETWHQYVRRLDVNDHYPGIQGIGFARKVVPGGQRERPEAWPDGERGAYYPITYLEPQDERNVRAIGFDMFSEPTRHAAMARARDLGRPALSAKVTLVQENGLDVQAGCLLYVPVYRQGADLSTLSGRREAIIGFAYSPFRMSDLMRGVLGGMAPKLQIRVLDGETTDAPPLFESAADRQGLYRHDETLMIFGRPWRVELQSTALWERGIDRGFPTLLFGLGLVISLLAAHLTYTLMMERERGKALAETNSRLSRSNAALTEARADAEAANRAKSKFLAAASHDIRQPVQSLTTFLYILRQQLGDDHAALQVVDYLEQAMAALQTLLDGLLDISRLDAGVIVAQPTKVELGPLLARLGQEYRPRATAKGLNLRVVATSASVTTDPALLERILRNLMENALRYTEHGGVLIGCRRHGGHLRLWVCDTGIGIAADQMEDIFEEFHQVGNAERDQAKGLGLGLSIVRRLSRLLDHRVEVRSQPGRGTCFMVEMPLDAVGVSAPGVSMADDCAGLGVTVVIDDEESVRNGLGQLMTSWGAEVVSAADADEAIRKLNGRAPDLILADYRLRGGRTGVEAVERLRRLHKAPIRSVIITGDTDAKCVAQVTGSGFEVLFKPVFPRDLRATLRSG